MKRKQRDNTGPDEKRTPPFLHLCVGTLSYLWLLPAILPFALLGKIGGAVPAVCLAFIISSSLTMLFYWEDKYRARHEYWRIPEKNLHLWELFCGWPGALFAQQIFKHKRKKLSFLAVFCLCTAANLLALCLIFRFRDDAGLRNELTEWLKRIFPSFY